MKYYKKEIDEIAFKSKTNPKTINLIIRAFKENYKINKSYAIALSDMISKIIEDEKTNKGEMGAHKIQSEVNLARRSIENLMQEDYIKLKSGKYETYIIPKKSFLCLLEKQCS